MAGKHLDWIRHTPIPNINLQAYLRILTATSNKHPIRATKARTYHILMLPMPFIPQRFFKTPFNIPHMNLLTV
ncbi:hypothetical protein Hanom_Chr10g00881721 [Helianthus anomalus]